MFLFRGRRTSQSPDVPSSVVEDSAGSTQNREFFAVRAARFLGGAARNVGTSLSKAVTGQSAEALQEDAETRARGSREVLAAAIADWARLLSAIDDTPRYESRSGGALLTFRAAFLQCRAFELSLSLINCRDRDSSKPVHETSTSPSFHSFLRAATVAGGEGLAARLPNLFSTSSGFSDCRRAVQELVLVLKADAQEEQIRTGRTQAGKKAEEIRSCLQAPQPNDKSEASCQSSAEAIRHYGTFRTGLAASISHLSVVHSDRLNRLQVLQEQLRKLSDDLAARKAAAVARKSESIVQCEAATVAPRKAVEEVKSDSQRALLDERLSSLEEERRRLQIQMESISQELAAKRDARMALHRRREEAVAEHRRRAEVVEQSLLSLRPAQFHRVLTTRADAMTEGEILEGLVKAAGNVKRHAEAAQNSVSIVDSSFDMAKKCDTVRVQAHIALREHAKLELTRLEVASAVVGQCITSLVDSAHARATRIAMGLQHETEAAYSNFNDFRDVKNLRHALKSAESAWSEAANLWGGDESGDNIVATFAFEDTQDVILQLEAARGRLAQSLVRLQQADPVTYEMVLQTGDGDGERASADTLPHGWEAHVSPENLVYYYNLVSQTSQWEPPTEDAAVSAGWRLVQSDQGGNWFYHNPYDGASMWWPELPSYPAAPTAVDSLRRDLK